MGIAHQGEIERAAKQWREVMGGRLPADGRTHILSLSSQGQLVVFANPEAADALAGKEEELLGELQERLRNRSVKHLQVIRASDAEAALASVLADLIEEVRS